LHLVARLFMFLLIFNEQRIPKITFVLVLTYYVKPHLFVILTAIGWFIVNIQSDLFWHRCLERQAFGTLWMYMLSPSKSIKGSNYGEFLKDKNVLLCTRLYKYVQNLESLLTQQYVCVMCTLWSDNTCVFTRFDSVKNANTQLIWSSASMSQVRSYNNKTHVRTVHFICRFPSPLRKSGKINHKITSSITVIPKVPWTSLDIWSSKGRTFTGPNNFLLDQKKLTQFKCNILFSCIFIYASSFQLHHANLHKSHHRHHLCHILHVMMSLLSS
jgi:hypothetical protein